MGPQDISEKHASHHKLDRKRMHHRHFDSNRKLGLSGNCLGHIAKHLSTELLGEPQGKD